jgi:hypothetical protein
MKLRYSLASLLLAAGLAGGVHAQAPPLADGKWTAEWNLPSGRPRSASLEIVGGTGTYANMGVGQEGDQCIRRPAPAKIEMREGTPHLVVLRSQVLSGCRDTVFKLNQQADGSVNSSFPDGRIVTFRKQ